MCPPVSKTADHCQVSFPPATHSIDALGRDDVSKEVILHGYVGQKSHISKKYSFLSLSSPDSKHRVQLVSFGESNPIKAQLKNVTAHTPVAIRGTVKSRESLPIKRDRRPMEIKHAGEIKFVEIEVSGIQVLNEFPTDIITGDGTTYPPEQRHLQIRLDSVLRKTIVIRSEVASICRNHLASKWGFVEVETPLLFTSTPEGAREFIIPTRRKGHAYSLPQSPQQFKQILMASGIPRYYQMARCFRDEDLRADRQPEFTQVCHLVIVKQARPCLTIGLKLDLEMGFADSEDVMGCIETLVKTLWKQTTDVTLPQFPRLTYTEAMATYGSDKPDTRLGMKFNGIGHLLPVDVVNKISPLPDPIVEALLFRPDKEGINHSKTSELIRNVPLNEDTNPSKISELTRNALDSSQINRKALQSAAVSETRGLIGKFLDSAEGSIFRENPDGAPGIFIYDPTAPLQGLQAFGFEAAEEIERLFRPKEGDLIVLQARPNQPFTGGSTSLGNLRLALHKEAVKAGLASPLTGFSPLWITDFPLFSPTSISEPGQGGLAGLRSTHHPFTSPKTPADVDLLLTDPTQVTGEHYDLVMNGVELGGGSKRIHSAEMQRFILSEVLKMPEEKIKKFDHLLEALRAGCPPHAGIALGFDRLIAVMLGKESVRDVIAFPKSGKGEDLMVKSPGVLTEEQLKTYHLKLEE